jgi:hypothetical protein
MAISSGVVALNSSTATKVCTMGESGALVYTTAAAGTVVIGGPGVTATTGVPLPASTYVQVPGARGRGVPVIPAVADDTADLYAISTTGTPSIAFLAPQGG